MQEAHLRARLHVWKEVCIRKRVHRTRETALPLACSTSVPLCQPAGNASCCSTRTLVTGCAWPILFLPQPLPRPTPPAPTVLEQNLLAHPPVLHQPVLVLQDALSAGQGCARLPQVQVWRCTGRPVSPKGQRPVSCRSQLGRTARASQAKPRCVDSHAVAQVSRPCSCPHPHPPTPSVASPGTSLMTAWLPGSTVTRPACPWMASPLCEWLA